MEHEGLYKKKEFEALDLPDIKKEQQANFTHVNCPSCSEPTTSENIDLGSKMAKCSNCNAVFSVEDNFRSLLVNLEDEIPRPEGVEILHFKDELELAAPQPMLIMDILILSVFPFVAIFAFLLYFAKNMEPAIFVGLISVAISTFSTVRVLRSKASKIYLLMDKKRLTIQWRPNYMRKDRTYEVEDIEQVYVKSAPDGIAICLILNSVDGQKHITIMKRMADLSQAKYLEQEIESYLQIQDRKVPGEI